MYRPILCAKIMHCDLDYPQVFRGSWLPATPSTTAKSLVRSTVLGGCWWVWIDVRWWFVMTLCHFSVGEEQQH